MRHQQLEQDRATDQERWQQQVDWRNEQAAQEQSRWTQGQKQKLYTRMSDNALLSGDPNVIKKMRDDFGIDPYIHASPELRAKMIEGQENRALRAQDAEWRREDKAANNAWRREHQQQTLDLRRDQLAMQAGKSNLPQPARGYIWGNAPDGSLIQIPVPGGPAAAKVEEAEAKKAQSQATRERQLNILSEDIGRAKTLADEEMLGYIPTVGAGSVFSNIPGTKAHDLAKTLDAIKARIGFDALQEMRANSPTGGALGSVSERENMLLQSVMGSLEQSQSKEAFIKNLERLENTYLDIVHGSGNWNRGKDGVQLKPAQNQGTKRLRYNPLTGGYE